jgi:hypothetical protein
MPGRIVLRDEVVAAFDFDGPAGDHGVGHEVGG